MNFDEKVKVIEEKSKPVEESRVGVGFNTPFPNENEKDSISGEDVCSFFPFQLGLVL